MVERLLAWYHSQSGVRYVALRYFNAAGATERLGEDHRPETHLIPIALQVAQNLRAALSLYGVDYPTKDGTCVRDYIHVSDLAQAHILALQKLEPDEALSGIYNLGNGNGFSNRQVIEAVRKVTGHPVPIVEERRRPGDPAELVASSSLAQTELGWRPQITTLEGIIESSWRWHKSYPDGYSD